MGAIYGTISILIVIEAVSKLLGIGRMFPYFFGILHNCTLSAIWLGVISAIEVDSWLFAYFTDLFNSFIDFIFNSFAGAK